MKGLSECKALESNIRRIRVKYIVKEVEDYWKTYSSAVIDISGYIHLCALCDVQEADSSRWSIEFWRMNEDFRD
ncbi:hypothetical protein Tco_1547978 [Tanacetum coccineum]